MTRVSVVIPAYRASGTIRRAVDSVLAQSHPVHEVIVVDDGSPDDMTTPLAGLPTSVRIVRQSNAGAGAARNTGIDQSSGDWIAFLDADDEWRPNKLAIQLQAATRFPEVNLIMGRFELRYAGTTEGQMILGKTLTGLPLTLQGDAAMRFAAMCWTGTVLVRRNALGEARFRTDLRTAEDRELWFRLILKGPVLAINEVLATQHVTGGSLSTTNIDDDCANMLRVIELHRDHLSTSERLAWQVELQRRRASVHLAEGRPVQAHQAAQERLKLQPFSPEAWYVWGKSLWRRGR